MAKFKYSGMTIINTAVIHDEIKSTKLSRAMHDG
jgi:hypothetical protein